MVKVMMMMVHVSGVCKLVHVITAMVQVQDGEDNSSNICSVRIAGCSAASSAACATPPTLSLS